MEKWQPVVTELERSLFGEQIVCSASTQLFHIPETKDLRGNAEMHTHLVPASYHRITAAGSAQRLLNGETAVSIVETLIACIQNSEQMAIESNGHLSQLSRFYNNIHIFL